MNFSAALEAMKAGKKVRRSCWGYGITLHIGTKEQFGHDLFYRKHQTRPDIGIEFYRIHDIEILAEDWELVDEYPKVELKQYFKCPRCNQNSMFDKKFLLVDPKGRDIIECENCGNKVEIIKNDHGTKACCGEVINPKDPDANNFKTVISREPRILFYKGNDLETWYEVEMIPDNIQKHIQKIKDFESTHIKTENVEYDEENGELTFQIVPIPRGMKIRINDLNRTPSEIDANINISLSKASYWLKEAAIKDVMVWIKEGKIKANVQGIDLFFDSGVPDNTILMNYTTFLTLKEMIEK